MKQTAVAFCSNVWPETVGGEYKEAKLLFRFGKIIFNVI